MNRDICQIQNINQVVAKKESALSILDQVRKLLGQWGIGKVKRRVMAFQKKLYLYFQQRKSQGSERTQINQPSAPAAVFQNGDWVRVRSLEEIHATLDRSGRLKGCRFMLGMQDYCGTNQRVFKVLKRFVDERNYEVKRSQNLYLLEGLMCQGTELYGPCDRSCLFFWRGEWLEKAKDA